MRRISRGPFRASFLMTAAAAAVAMSAAAAWPRAAHADGALAVGQPADVAGQGFAYGVTVNAQNSDAASSAALDACRGAKGARPTAQSVCKVVGTLHQQCAAVAMDPAAGTPGAGWAIAYDKSGAESEALQACQSTAGTARVAYCKVVTSMCDEGSVTQRNQ